MPLLRRLGAAAGWLTLIMAVAGLTWAVGVEGWSDRWGATDDEVAASLPGDDLIEDPAMVTTRAVTVAAPPELVWPWIAQFGQGRGGLYSYDWLERLFGMDITSVDTVLPGEQDIAVGDQVWITQPGTRPTSDSWSPTWSPAGRWCWRRRHPTGPPCRRMRRGPGRSSSVRMVKAALG